MPAYGLPIHTYNWLGRTYPDRLYLYNYVRIGRTYAKTASYVFLQTTSESYSLVASEFRDLLHGVIWVPPEGGYE